jgi:hypothetical protein
LALEKVTDAQRKERQKDYQLKLKKQMENEKISNDDMDILVGSLTLVAKDLEGVLRGENPDAYIQEDHHNRYSSEWTGSKYISQLFSNLFFLFNRWIFTSICKRTLTLC